MYMECVYMHVQYLHMFYLVLFPVVLFHLIFLKFFPCFDKAVKISLEIYKTRTSINLNFKNCIYIICCSNQM